MKILILTVPEVSHVKSFLHLYNELVEHNDVTMYCGEEQQKLIDNQKIQVRFYNDYFLNNVFRFNAGLRGDIGVLCEDKNFSEETIQNIADQFRASYVFRIRCMKKYIKMLKEDFSSYDFVFYDYYLYFGEYISSTYHIPSASLMPTLIPLTGMRDKYLNAFINYSYLFNIFSYPPDANMLVEIVDDMSEKITKTSKHAFDFFTSGMSRYNLVSSSKVLYPYDSDETLDVKRKIAFIGRKREDVRVERPRKNNDVLVYLGRINDEVEAGILIYLIKKLGQTQYKATVAISNLKEWDENIEKYAAENVCLDDDVDFKKKMSETCLYICHGGLGGLQEAVLNEVPVLCIPTSGERYEVAERFGELGAGLSIKADIEELEEKLVPYIQVMLKENSYKENTKKIGDSLVQESKHVNAIITKVLEDAKKGKEPYE